MKIAIIIASTLTSREIQLRALISLQNKTKKANKGKKIHIAQNLALNHKVHVLFRNLRRNQTDLYDIIYYESVVYMLNVFSMFFASFNIESNGNYYII